MKFNKWTLGLAALGVVSLASAVKADEKQNFLQTALSSTTISGYVDTSIEEQLSPYDAAERFPIPFRGVTKQDGFNLNVVKVTIEKPLDESEWASGYKVDLLFGPDAVGYNAAANSRGDSAIPVNNGGDLAIKQAYVSLRVPIGNGLEFKVGTFDTIIGYEVFESGNNPNFTRSWGYAVEPTEHTGILASYRVNDVVSLSGGVANTLSAGIDTRNTEGRNPFDSYWNKTVMGSIALTAPTSWGWAAGSALYGGVVYGFGATSGVIQQIGQPANNVFPTAADPQANYYAGLTLNTPIASLKGGIAYDHVHNIGGLLGTGADIIGLYASYQATEKLSLNGRGEIGWWQNGASFLGFNGITGNNDETSISLTGTVQYDLWANTISRLEVRWDQFHGVEQGVGAETVNQIGLYANIIYKF